MRDVLRLRDQIARALMLFPLSTALAACGNDEPKPVAPNDVPTANASATSSATVASTSPPASASAVATTSASVADTPIPAPIPPPEMHFPTCPHGDFCAPKSLMTKLAKKGSPTTLDCPTDVEVSEKSKVAAPGGMISKDRGGNAFSEAATRAARGDGGIGDACCYTWYQLCPGGRPHLDGDTSIVAKARAGSSWSRKQRDLDSAIDPKSREKIGQLWLADALSEHASIASFARATIELMAVGAPIELVSECARASLDEARHAERCFEIARGYGVAQEPGPLPALAPRATDLARLARDTFIEGCVGETISALAALRAQANAPKEIRDAWRMLANDEARHAALAWKTVAWILRQKQGDFARELVAFADAEHAKSNARPAPPSNEPALAGRLSAREAHALTQEAWREIILPTLRDLVTKSDAA